MPAADRKWTLILQHSAFRDAFRKIRVLLAPSELRKPRKTGLGGMERNVVE